MKRWARTAIALVVATSALAADRPWQTRTITAEEPSLLYNIQVLAGRSLTLECPSGWSRDQQDLNEGTRGDPIIVCKQFAKPSRTAERPITGVYAITMALGEALPSCHDGDRVINVDLNRGAGGAYVWFCVARDGRAPALRDLTFAASDLKSAPDQQNACRTIDASVDLNRGAGGKYIYPCTVQ